MRIILMLLGVLIAVDVDARGPVGRQANGKSPHVQRGYVGAQSTAKPAHPKQAGKNHRSGNGPIYGYTDPRGK